MHTRVIFFVQSEIRRRTVCCWTYSWSFKLPGEDSQLLWSYSELAVVNGPLLYLRFLAVNFMQWLICVWNITKTSGCFDVTVHSRIIIRILFIRYVYRQKNKVFLLAAGDNDQPFRISERICLGDNQRHIALCSIENALINMGNSSVLVPLGNHPAGTGWKVNFVTSRRRKRPGSLKVYFIMNASLLPETSRRGAGILFLLKWQLCWRSQADSGCNKERAVGEILVYRSVCRRSGTAWNVACQSPPCQSLPDWLLIDRIISSFWR